MIIEFIGKLHPIMVHLPIGIFLIGILMEFMARKKQFSFLEDAMKLIFMIGVLSGIVSLITGYYLSLDGSNESEDVDKHKWIAIGTIILFIAYYFIRSYLISKKNIQTVVLLVLLTMISITGHLGGSLTHGDGYLTSAFYKDQNRVLTTSAASQLEDINDAMLFDDVVLYTMTQKCIQCHSEDRQKGKLRLDSKEWILKGGKNGNVIDINNPNNSEILKRLFLELNDEHHMPPKDKEQLTDEELVIMRWWIQNGAGFDKKVAVYERDTKINKALKSFHERILATSNNSAKKTREKVSEIPLNIKTILEKSGWVLSPLSISENYVRVAGFNLEVPLESALEELKKIQKQTVELKLSYKAIDDSNIGILISFKNLEKLWIDHSKITDNSLKNIEELNNLTYLNISNTSIGIEGIKKMSGNKSLEKIYAFNTKVNKSDLAELSKTMPRVRIFIAADTMEMVLSDTLLLRINL
jgi:uncharacterized membrane protein